MHGCLWGSTCTVNPLLIDSGVSRDFKEGVQLYFGEDTSKNRLFVNCWGAALIQLEAVSFGAVAVFKQERRVLMCCVFRFTITRGEVLRNFKFWMGKCYEGCWTDQQMVVADWLTADFREYSWAARKPLLLQWVESPLWSGYVSACLSSEWHGLPFDPKLSVMHFQLILQDFS